MSMYIFSVNVMYRQSTYHLHTMEERKFVGSNPTVVGLYFTFC